MFLALLTSFVQVRSQDNVPTSPKALDVDDLIEVIVADSSNDVVKTFFARVLAPKFGGFVAECFPDADDDKNQVAESCEVVVLFKDIVAFRLWERKSLKLTVYPKWVRLQIFRVATKNDTFDLSVHGVKGGRLIGLEYPGFKTVDIPVTSVAGLTLIPAPKLRKDKRNRALADRHQRAARKLERLAMRIGQSKPDKDAVEKGLSYPLRSGDVVELILPDSTGNLFDLVTVKVVSPKKGGFIVKPVFVDEKKVDFDPDESAGTAVHYNEILAFRRVEKKSSDDLEDAIMARYQIFMITTKEDTFKVNLHSADDSLLFGLDYETALPLKIRRSDVIRVDLIRVPELDKKLALQIDFQEAVRGAVDWWLKAAELEQQSVDPRPDQLALALNNAGWAYMVYGEPEKAIPLFERAFLIDADLGFDHLMAFRVANLGLAHLQLNRFETAVQMFGEAMLINEKLGEGFVIAALWYSTGLAYERWAEHESAPGLLEQAVAAYSRTLEILDYAMAAHQARYPGEGDVGRWATWQEEKRQLYECLAGTLFAIGGGMYKLKRYPEAINFLGSAKKAFEAAERPFAFLVDLFFGRSHNPVNDVLDLIHEEMWAVPMGLTYQTDFLSYKRIIEFLEASLSLKEDLGKKRDVAFLLYEIGLAYKKSGKGRGKENFFNRFAVEYLENAVKKREQLLSKGQSEWTRFDHAKLQLTYQDLISSYVDKGEIAEAIEALQNSRLKLSASQFGDSLNATAVPSLKKIQKAMPKDAAIILITNVNRQDKVVVGITRKSVFGDELSDRDFVAEAMKAHGPSIRSMVKDRGSVDLVLSKELDYLQKTADRSAGTPDSQLVFFEDVIDYYCRSLKDSTYGGGNEPLANLLYEFLVGPLLKELKGKKELIFVVDGVLRYVPFETLIDDQGKYLVENYTISYANSPPLIDSEKSQLESDRKEMLLIRDANYDNLVGSQAVKVRNQGDLETIGGLMNPGDSDRISVFNAYLALGISEIRSVRSFVSNDSSWTEGTTILAGEDADEGKIKSISQTGELADFNIVHISAHNQLISAVPGLSAIVLSSAEDSTTEEDGFLFLREIAELDVRAELVNLPSTVTGDGRVGDGTAIFGLVDAFIIAGAEAVSFSLWLGADEPTQKFVTAMYLFAKNNDVPYPAAMTAVKRRFISGELGEKFRSPFYWAPFVYYLKP